MNTISELRPGQLLGRYEILAPIAQGGMAAVWAARQWGSRGFTKIVAIKTMLPTISDDPRFERMFLDEARIASRIHHDHVVEILDLGEQNAVLYLVMEWVDGDSLSTIRRAASAHGGIPVAVAARIIADACSGLHAAHELRDDEGRSFGLVHRDVSPQNILVGHDGGVKVLDFGVAKVAGRVSDTTNVGHARGKPPYMAPEQALGKAIDRRADIFSLGIVLYQLIADRHPFRGESDIATLHNIVSDVPVVAPRTFVPSLSEGLERLMLKALQRDPEKRFQTAQQMEFELEELLDKELGRVRAEEIGRLATSWLGSRGEDRRHALREAIRRADTLESTQADIRSQSRGSRPSLAPELASSPGTSFLGAGHTPSRLSTPPGRNEGLDDERTEHVVVDFSPERGETERTLAQGDERTVAEMTPNWDRDVLATTAEQASAEHHSTWFASLPRSVLTVLLAMLLGAVVAWVALAGHFRTPADAPSSSASRTEPSGTTRLPTSAPPIASEPAPVKGSMADAGAGAPTVESRSAPESKSQGARNRKRSDGPTYHLPPISSPGF